MNRPLKLNLLILTVSIYLMSCSTDKMQYMSINCLCEFTAHYVASTNEEDNQVREYTFTNSRLFDQGVTQESFARSSAIQLNKDLKLDSQEFIKINLVTEKEKGKQKRKSFEYTPKELLKLTPKFNTVKDLATGFVESIYNESYNDASQYVSIDIEQEKFITILKQAKSGLEEGYVDTRIVSFEEKNGVYHIYGGVWAENEVLDLFQMQLKDTDNGLKIVGFSF